MHAWTERVRSNGRKARGRQSCFRCMVVFFRNAAKCFTKEHVLEDASGSGCESFIRCPLCECLQSMNGIVGVCRRRRSAVFSMRWLTMTARLSWTGQITSQRPDVLQAAQVSQVLSQAWRACRMEMDRITYAHAMLLRHNDSNSV